MKIIRPHHPLRDQEFEVLKADPHRLVVRHVDGGSLTIPRAWTNADGESAVQPRAHPQVFTVDALQALLDLTDALGQRD